MGMTAAQTLIGDGSTSSWLFESPWDKIWRRPHDVQISPYDPDKGIRVVDANNHLSASSRIMESSVYMEHLRQIQCKYSD
jgi:hypothetical protein